MQVRDSDFGFLSGFDLRVSDFKPRDLQRCLVCCGATRAYRCPACGRDCPIQRHGAVLRVTHTPRETFPAYRASAFLTSAQKYGLHGACHGRGLTEWANQCRARLGTGKAAGGKIQHNDTRRTTGCSAGHAEPQQRRDAIRGRGPNGIAAEGQTSGRCNSGAGHLQRRVGLPRDAAFDGGGGRRRQRCGGRGSGDRYVPPVPWPLDASTGDLRRRMGKTRNRVAQASDGANAV
jgi:hypothetical protein